MHFSWYSGRDVKPSCESHTTQTCFVLQDMIEVELCLLIRNYAVISRSEVHNSFDPEMQIVRLLCEAIYFPDFRSDSAVLWTNNTQMDLV